MQAETPLSEFLLARAAAGLDRLRAPRGPFDIRVLGAIHLALLLAFLVLVAGACRGLPAASRWAALGLAVFFFTDVGYVAPFNSLYGQVASLLFFLLAAGIAAAGIRRGRLDGVALPAYFACCALFVVSKPQECLHGPILAALGIALARAPGRRIGREPAVWLGIALWRRLLVVLLRHTPQGRSRGRSLPFRVHGVAAHLAGSGLRSGRDGSGRRPRASRRRDGLCCPTRRSRYRPFVAAFFNRFGYADLLRFYATHPRRLVQRLARAGRRAFTLRPGNLGNFEQASGLPAGAQSRRFDAWSKARLTLGSAALLWIVALLVINLVAAARAGARSERLLRDGLLALCAMAALEFGVCAMADFLDDASRHLYVFQAMWDVLVIIDVAWLAWILSGSAARMGGAREPWRSKVGGWKPRD